GHQRAAGLHGGVHRRGVPDGFRRRAHGDHHGHPRAGGVGNHALRLRRGGHRRPREPGRRGAGVAARGPAQRLWPHDHARVEHGLHVPGHGAGAHPPAPGAVGAGRCPVMARTGSFSMNRRNSAWTERGGWPWLAFVAVAAVLPLVLREFHVHLLTEILILGLFAAAFNLLFGYTGLLSFGQAAYFAIGAYACAPRPKGPWPSLPVGLIAGAVLAAAAALVVGYLCVRRDEIYFAMVTLACGQLIFVALWRWREVTGGSDGIGGIPRPPLDLGAWAVSLAPTLHFYYFTLAVVAGALYVLWRITRSPFGLALRAVRDNHRRVDYLGLPMRRYRLAAFTVSGLFCGLAGALFAPYQGTITP